MRRGRISRLIQMGPIGVADTASKRLMTQGSAWALLHLGCPSLQRR
jgi:hypothetical protein